MSEQNELEVLFTEEELARIDALIPRYSTASHQATRADVLRAAALAGIDALERGDLPPPEESTD